MVSILLPAYNSVQFISLSIMSILNQSFKEFELLIIDDGSNDETEEIVQSYKDSRIRFVKKDHTGLSDSLNYGLKLATFDLIARMDADDIAHPLRIERQLSFMKRSPDNLILSSWYAVFENNHINYIVRTPTEHKDIVKGLLLYSFISHPATMYNRKIIMELGGYEGEVFEDYLLWLKIKDYVQFAIIPEVLLFYRYRRSSISRMELKHNYKMHYHIQQFFYDNILENFNITSKDEELIFHGWREFFFGNKKFARLFWKKNKLFIKDAKLFCAFFLTFLPESIFTKLKEMRIRYRLMYLLNFFSKDVRNIRRTFRKLYS